jgi:hypothetical protein
VLERAQAYPAERLVSGQAEPSASITVTVDTGEWLSATYTQASSVGEYSVLLPPGVVIEGSTVRVDHNRGAHEMQIQGVVAWALPPGGHAGLMTGRDLATTGGAPDGVPVEMVYRRAEPQPLVIVRTESSHGGGVHAGGPMTNRSSVLRAEVHAWLPGAFVLVGPLDLDRANSSILLPSVRSAR